MSGRSTTYATILPDDTGDDHGSLGYPPKLGGQIHHPPKNVENVDRTKNEADDQKQIPLNEREMIKRQIVSNKKVMYGLLLVAAFLMIALVYVVIQNRRLTSLDAAPASKMPPVIQGTGPPGQQMYQYPNTQLPQTDNVGSNARATEQNDKLLRQKQHRAPTQSRQSALARSRQGHSDQDDKQRLETIVEENESPLDDIAARTRAYIAAQLREGAIADARDEPLGTGSFELDDTEAKVRDSQDWNSECEASKDDAAITTPNSDAPADQDDDSCDADDDTQPAQAKITALCSVVLAGGRRAGQECNRECAPGKTMCKRHMGPSTRKK